MGRSVVWGDDDEMTGVHGLEVPSIELLETKFQVCP